MSAQPAAQGLLKFTSWHQVCDHSFDVTSNNFQEFEVEFDVVDGPVQRRDTVAA